MEEGTTAGYIGTAENDDEGQYMPLATYYPTTNFTGE